MASELRCDLLLFYATTTEKEQLQAMAAELGIPFERNTHERFGRYHAPANSGACPDYLPTAS